MDKRLLDLFVHEVRSQSEFIVYGVQELMEALEQPFPTKEQFRSPQWRAAQERNAPQPWFAIQGIVIAAGNLSKLFWGREKEKSEKQRAPLRAALGVPDASFLRNANLRNRFEHFDEDLVQWHKRQVKRQKMHGGSYHFMARNMGNSDPFSSSGPKDEDRFAHYDPSSGVLTTLGRTLSLPDIITEATRLLKACSTHLGL